jgi:hypothetical protein
MNTHISRNNTLPLEKLAEATGRGMLNYQSATHRETGATTRQKKHDMLVTFMANTKVSRKKTAPARGKPKLLILRSLLSFFI